MVKLGARFRRGRRGAAGAGRVAVDVETPDYDVPKRGRRNAFGGAGADAELRALRSARRSLSLQIAAVIAVVIAALGAFAYHLEQVRQNAEIQQTLQLALGGTAPTQTGTCLWVFVLDDGKVEAPRQYPAGLPLTQQMFTTEATHRPAQTQLTADGTEYAVLTADGPGGVRQAVFDTRYQRQDMRSLLEALLIAEAVGVAASLLVGRLLAHRSLTPLGRALAKQRRFVADASHELRTPLTRVHTRAQLLLRRQRGKLPPDVVAELEQLVHSSRELGELVEDLLLSASLRPGEQRANRVDLARVAAEVVEAERPRAAENALTVTLVTTAQAAIPSARAASDRVQAAHDQSAARSGTEVHGLESPLRRMVSALVDNAIGHTGPGGSIEISVQPAGRGRWVELTVADDGAGFDPADAARIFERFARGSAGRGRRFGLGLALVREIVQSHGGEIEAVGRPGEGARFTVRIPAARPPRRTTRAHPASTDGAAASAPAPLSADAALGTEAATPDSETTALTDPQKRQR